MKKVLKILQHIILTPLVYAFYYMFRVMPLLWMHGLSKHVVPFLGRLTGVNSMMKRNIAERFPDLNAVDVERIARESWQHLGYVMCEYNRMDSFAAGIHDPRIEVEGLEHLQKMIDDGKPGIIFTAHYGSWQLITCVGRSLGLNVGQVFRAANNPAADWVMEKTQMSAVDHVFRRGRAGTKALVDYMEKGGHTMMMVDQNFYEGFILPFLGRPAFTAPGLVRMKRKYNCPVIPARVVRLAPDHFKVTYYPEMILKDTGDQSADDEDFMGRVNDLISAWIREYPAQWMWQHNRWKVERILKIREQERLEKEAEENSQEKKNA